MALLRANFNTEFDAQNAGNGVSGVQISNIFRGAGRGGGGACPRTPLDFVVPPNFRIMLQSDFLLDPPLVAI
jgi:hypothetical protein